MNGRMYVSSESQLEPPLPLTDSATSFFRRSGTNRGS